jgi:hypothetical protein
MGRFIMENVLSFEGSLLWAQDWVAILIFVIFFVVGELLLVKWMKNDEQWFGTFLILNIFLLIVVLLLLVPVTLLIIEVIKKFTMIVLTLILIASGFVALKLLIYNIFIKGDKE